MDIKDIQELLKFVKKNGFGEFNLEDGDFKLSVKTAQPAKSAPPAVSVVPQLQPVPMPVAAPVAPPAAASAPAEAAPSTEATTPKVSEANLVEIKSPIVGTFYRSSGPDKPAFVKVGDSVEQGQTVCIVEAMKLFNEIESEVSGTIVKVMVEDAQPVQFDQVLFLVEQ